MSTIDKRFKLSLNGRCDPDCVVQGDTYRFTILTPQMLRMEYAEDGWWRIRLSTA